MQKIMRYILCWNKCKKWAYWTEPEI